MHANEREALEDGLRRRHRRPGRAEADRHRGHALRQGPPDRPRVDHLPRARDLHGDRAEERRRQGQARGGPRHVWRGRTRPSGPRSTRRRGRRSSRGWGSSTSRSCRHRLVTDFRVEANVGKPRVSYRQTVRGPRGGRAAPSSASSRARSRSATVRLARRTRRARKRRHVRGRGPEGARSTRSSGPPSKRGSCSPPREAWTSDSP